MPDKQAYIGRFAPSPTGPLHFGSLYTALASFLQARSKQGLWLLRIDDLDTPRNIKGAADNILTTLETFGLHWDNHVAYQSQAVDIYHQVLDNLLKEQLIYPCTCSRKTLTTVYSGTCRNKQTLPQSPYSYRLKTDSRVISFNDGLQGLTVYNLAEQGDFILKRKDQFIAYQFAVVIDDNQQQINHVVRGYDLLASTPRQIYLQHILGFDTPAYMHVPIIIDKQGYKLSKQTLATAVDIKKPNALIFELLTALKQNPALELKQASVNELLNWGIAHWNPEPLKNCREISPVKQAF
ncbi:MAG: tRNA glutamyl-Q(34) synthetase GluQRS [Methylococcales bacterium]|nr:tRNA glutamyl-Q(34) synthetase GluQRS [Methylococcales bacterium]